MVQQGSIYLTACSVPDDEAMVTDTDLKRTVVLKANPNLGCGVLHVLIDTDKEQTDLSFTPQLNSLKST